MGLSDWDYIERWRLFKLRDVKDQIHPKYHQGMLDTVFALAISSLGSQ